MRLGFFWFWVWGLASLGIVCAWFRVDFFKVGPPLMLETAKIAQADLCTFCMNGGFDSCKKTGLTSSGFRQVWFRASLIQGLFGLSLAFVFAFFQDLTSLGGFPWACLGSASLGFDWVRFRAWSICASLIGFGSWLGFFRLCFACLGWYRA